MPHHRTPLLILFVAILVSVSLGQPPEKKQTAKKQSEPGKTTATSKWFDLTASLRAIRARNQLIRKALKKEAPLAFTKTPLDKVVEQIGHLAGVNLLLNKEDLLDEVIEPTTPVTRTWKLIAMDSALDQVLEPLGLGWHIVSETVVVTSRLAIESFGPYPIELYDCRDLYRRGVDIDRLIRLVMRGTSGPWGEHEGHGGTVVSLGDILVVSHHGRIQREVADLLAGLRRQLARVGHDRPELVQLAGPADQAAHRSLTRVVTVDVSEKPLPEVLADLGKQAETAIRLDGQALLDEGIEPREPITLSLKTVSLHSALNHALEPLGCLAIVRDGSLLVTTEVVAEEMTEPLFHTIAGLTRAGLDIQTLADVIESGTNCPWEDVDGYGGLIFAISPDVLFVRQTQRGHQEVSLELFHLRARLSARRSADGKPLPPSPSPHLTRIYDSGDFPAYDLALAIPRFVSPRSWNAADGRGEIRQVAELLVIRQTADVHFQVRLFLDRLDVHRGVNLPSPTNPWGAWGPTPAPPSRTLDEPRPR